jgi:MOSC domain-containing protein YiiM
LCRRRPLILLLDGTEDDRGMTETRGCALALPELAGRIVSVQVGQPAPLRWRDRTLETAIVKCEVAGSVALGEAGLEGDGQADVSAHGGRDKAICAYPVEHVSDWEQRLGVSLPPGAFGENLTLSGLVEEAVHIGDVFEVGTGILQVSQPRGPCFKLAARWGHRELPGLMARAGRSGYYFRVLRTGQLEAGHALRLIERHSSVSVAEVMRVTYVARGALADVDAVLEVPELAERWRRSLDKVPQSAGEPIEDFGL